jgi:PAS domain S-box-containing protein
MKNVLLGSCSIQRGAILRFAGAALRFGVVLAVIFSGMARADADSHNPVSEESSVSNIKVLKTIIVPHYYPYSFIDNNGNPDGFSVDIVKSVAEVMDLKVQIEVGPWEKAIDALERGAIDFLPMMAYSAERSRRFDFSVPHTISYDAIFVRKGSASIKSFSGLTGKTVIVLNRDAAHDYLLSSGMADRVGIIVVETVAEGLRLLSSETADALIMPKLVGLLVLKQLNITNIGESPEVIDIYSRPFCFAVKKGANHLLESLSQGLSIVEATGKYRSVYAKWFGVIEGHAVSWKPIIRYGLGIVAVFTLIGLALLLWVVTLRKQVALRTKTLEMEILERNKIEKALRESEKRFRAIFDNAGVGIDLLDAEGRIAQANQSLLNIVGYSFEELRELTFLGITHPDDRDISERSLKALDAGERNAYRLEKRYLRRDGSLVWCELSTSSIRDADGKRIGTIGVIEDVSERKRAEEALRDSEARLNSILAASPVGIAVLKDRKLTWVNDVGLKMFGYESNVEVVGKSTNIFYPSQDEYELAGKKLYASLNGNQVSQIFTKFKRKDGSLFDADMRMKLVDTNAHGSLAVAIIIDITEQLKNERERELLRAELLQAQKMEAIGTLVGGIAHDFNNMLQVILGYSQMLLEEKSPDHPDYEDLREIVRASEQEAELVRRLLIFAKKTPTEKVTTELNSQVKGMTSLLSRTFPKMIDIKLDLADGLNMIMADPVQIDQVIMNLTINAQESMPKGGQLGIKTRNVTLDDEYVCYKPGLKSGKYVMLSISDTGLGMNQQTLSRIFEPFFSTKERDSTRGTGLGLSVVQGIVEQHGGHIICESEPEKGSEFRIYFPAIEFAKKTEELVKKSPNPTGTGTILLVEDEPLVVEFGKRILSGAGYNVIVGSNGREALDIYQNRKDEIALVVLDLMMPEMSGRDCLKELVKLDPLVKVIIATGFSIDASVEEEINPFIKGIVKKPFRISEFVWAIHDALS